MRKLISIDHGNSDIKTVNHVFPASYVEIPGIGGNDVLKFKGKTYTLVDQSLPVLNDKTVDERYYILTLIALGKELKEDAEMIKKLTPNEAIKVDLLVGLPLQHYEAYRKKFQEYFCSSDARTMPVEFEFNGRSYRMQIASTHVFPQAFSAALTAYNELKSSKIVNIVDIGGFTVDCLQLNNFTPNMTLCTSLYWGVRTLFNNINDKARSLGGNDIADDIIKSILIKDEHALEEYSEKRINMIQSTAETHAKRMLAEVAQKGFDLEEDKTVFMGGGAILMKDYILKADRAKKPIFIDDVHANAKGYEILYNMKKNDGQARNMA